MELFGHVEERPGLTRWRQGRCLPYGDGIAFWALGEIVKAESGILESDSTDEVRAKLERALPEIFRLTPTNIRRTLKLNRPIYRRTAAYGHFGRAPDKDGGFSWEKTDLADQLKRALR